MLALLSVSAVFASCFEDAAKSCIEAAVKGCVEVDTTGKTFGPGSTAELPTPQLALGCSLESAAKNCLEAAAKSCFMDATQLMGSHPWEPHADAELPAPARIFDLESDEQLDASPTLFDWCRRRQEEGSLEGAGAPRLGVQYCIRMTPSIRMFLGDHGFQRSGNGWYFPNSAARPHIHIAIDGGYLMYIGMTRGGNNGALYTFFNGGLINDELPPQTAVVHEDLLHAGILIMEHLGLVPEWMRPDDPSSGSDGPDMTIRWAAAAEAAAAA